MRLNAKTQQHVKAAAKKGVALNSAN